MRSSLPLGRQRPPVAADLAEPRPAGVSTSSPALLCCRPVPDNQTGMRDSCPAFAPSPPGAFPLLPHCSLLLCIPCLSTSCTSPGALVPRRRGWRCQCPRPGQSCTASSLRLEGPPCSPALLRSLCCLPVSSDWLQAGVHPAVSASDQWEVGSEALPHSRPPTRVSSLISSLLLEGGWRVGNWNVDGLPEPCCSAHAKGPLG